MRISAQNLKALTNKNGGECNLKIDIYISLSSYFTLQPVNTFRTLSNDVMTKPTINTATRNSLDAEEPLAPIQIPHLFVGKND